MADSNNPFMKYVDQGPETAPTDNTTAPNSENPFLKYTDPNYQMQQAATEPQPEDKESLGYTLQHPGEAFSALGSALINPQTWKDTGRRVALATLGTRDTADWEHPLGYLSPYASLSDVSTTDKQKAEELQTVGREGLKLAAYGAAAEATGGLAVPVLDAVGLSPALTALGGSVASNVAGSLASQSIEGDYSLGQTAQDVVLGEAFRLGGLGVQKGARRVYNAVRPVSEAERAARVVNPEYVSDVLQGGNQEAQQAFRTATTNQAGESILNPSQVFNTGEGAKYIRAEQRDINRGTESQYAAREAAQNAGAGFERAIDDLSTATDPNQLQQSAIDAVEAFKQQKNAMYQDSKQGAQDILNSYRIKSIKMPETKQLIDRHLNENGLVGGIKLTPETTSTLEAFKKAKIRDVNDLDLWKRTLAEKQNKAYRAGDYESSKALTEVSNSLKSEGDKFISAVDPKAGNLWKDADTFFKQSVGDFGDKSVLGKLASKENPTAAGETIFGGGVNAQFNADEIANALNDAIARGDINGISDIAQNLGAGAGNYARQRALSKATDNGVFSMTKFRNALGKTQGQVESLGQFSNAPEADLHSALTDAANRMQRLNRAKVDGGRFTSNIAQGAGNAAAKAVGAVVGHAAGPIGAVMGAEIGGRLSKAINNGLLDRLMGTTNKANEIIEYLSNPTNAQKVDDILSRGGHGHIDEALPANIANVVENLTNQRAARTATIVTNQFIGTDKEKNKK